MAPDHSRWTEHATSPPASRLDEANGSATGMLGRHDQRTEAFAEGHTVSGEDGPCCGQVSDGDAAADQMRRRIAVDPEAVEALDSRPATPGSISIGSENIWISLPGLGQLVRFNPLTRRRRSFPASGGPSALAAGSKALWVAEAHSRALAQFNGDWRTGRGHGAFPGPRPRS